MDEEMRKEFPNEVSVKLKGFRRYKGYSDLLVTFCCSATPCYFVIFPGIGYEGYFEAKDVIFEKDVKAGRM